MHPVNPEMTIGDLIRSGVYGVFADYIFTYMTPDHFYAPLKTYGFEKVGFIEGLSRMEELAASDGKNGTSYRHRVYSDEECLSQWDKALAEYLFFPAEGNEGG